MTDIPSFYESLNRELDFIMESNFDIEIKSSQINQLRLFKTGEATRRADKLIQDLFNHGQIINISTSHRPNLSAAQSLFDRIQERLTAEYTETTFLYDRENLSIKWADYPPKVAFHQRCEALLKTFSHL
jgi:hypothetical protein